LDSFGFAFIDAFQNVSISSTLDVSFFMLISQWFTYQFTALYPLKYCVEFCCNTSVNTTVLNLKSCLTLQVFYMALENL